MAEFDTYVDRFEHIALTRTDGILELRFHTDGGPLQWTPQAHHEAAAAFREIGNDLDNRVVIITGTGAEYSGPRGTEVKIEAHARRAEDWDVVHAHGIELMDALLRIPAIVIGAVNGPALRHCEIPLMSDIVICSESAEFQDSGHFPDDLTPGDGINVLMPLVFGLTRAKYFHLTGQVITAQQALELGLVNEVLPAEQLIDRAWQLARDLVTHRPMVLRHTRLLNTHTLRRLMHDLVPYGLALEGLDQADAMDRRVSTR